MNKMIKKSILLILIATILIAPSMSLTQVHARETPPPIPTGPIYFYPSIDNVANCYSSSYPPSSGGEDSAAVQLLSPAFTGYQEYPLPNIMTQYFYVNYNTYPGSVISGRVEVFIQYDPGSLTLCQQKHLRLCIYDPVDFNIDGTVNLQDVVLMLQAIRQQQSGVYNPTYDLNHDGVVNCADLQIVLQFLIHGLIVNQGGHLVRLPWMDITAGVDTVHHYVYGFTDHFSVFGVH